MLSENIGRNAGGHLTFAGFDVSKLAAKYGTPLYLMDEQRVRDNCRMYADAFRKGFGDKGKVLYASKAAAFKQMYRIVAEEGLGADVVSAGEICTAAAAGFPMENVYFHGNAKTDEDIRFAISQHVGYFVADNVEELMSISREAGKAGVRQKVLLRVTPGIDPHTYAAVNTGMVDSKFGVAIETGQAEEFVRLALAQKNIDVRGLHCHVGSQVFDEDVYERSSVIMIGFMDKLRRELGIVLPELDMGGGYGVQYLESGKKADIHGRIIELAGYMKAQFEKLDYPLPAVIMEPGRSLVADAGMTVYTAVSVKEIPGYKNYVAIDGGMTDNPRYALYQAEYTVLSETERGEQQVFDLVGRCCESDDIIQPAVRLNSDTKRGDLIAVCTTGAYNYSMASNYNRIPRPPVVMLFAKGDYIAVRRETNEDIIDLDV